MFRHLTDLAYTHLNSVLVVHQLLREIFGSSAVPLARCKSFILLFDARRVLYNEFIRAFTLKTAAYLGQQMTLIAMEFVGQKKQNNKLKEA